MRTSAPAAATRADPLPRGADIDVKGITPYLTSNDTFYRVDVALKVPQIDADAWRLKIHGLVDREIELSFDDILAMPLVERRITLTCVSNQVGDHYVGNATWLGVPMRATARAGGCEGRSRLSRLHQRGRHDDQHADPGPDRRP